MVLNKWLSGAHSQRIRKTNNVGARKLKGLNMIVNISYGYLYLREIELMLNTVYYFETVHFKHKYLLKHVRVETVTTGLTIPMGTNDGRYHGN